MAKIISTAPVFPICHDLLADHGTVEICPDMSADTLKAMIADADAVIVRGEAQITEDVLTAANQVKVIARTGVGYNNVDVDALTRRGIPLVFTPGANARAVAEASMAAILSLVKHLPIWNERMKAGDWNSRFEIDNDDLDGGVLGIIGLGNIGQTLAKMAAGFNMTVQAYDPYLPDEVAASVGAKLVSLEELLSTSKFINIHATMTEETRNLVNEENMKLIQPGSYLVNLARGELIDSLDSVLDALNDGRLRATLLDVFAPEPPDFSHAIFSHPMCFTAPHSLGLSKQAMTNIFQMTCDGIKAVLDGNQWDKVVNPEVWDSH